MQKLHVAISCFLLFVVFATAQKKQVTVEDIYNGTFVTAGLEELHSLKNGKQYTVLHTDSQRGLSSIDIYDYATQEKMGTMLSSLEVDGLPFFTSYAFSADENKVLLSTEVEPIFRRSTKGRFYVYDVSTKEVIAIANEKIQEPALSPNGKKVAYALDNNLYVMDLQTKAQEQLTFDGKKNEIINGITDWVYEEEFAFVRAFEWNSDGTAIAYLKFNETDVPQFSMDVYGTQLYPEQTVFKYPKAGEVNAKVSLHLLNVASGEHMAVELGNPEYIPRIKWMQHPRYLSVQTLNRHQNRLLLHRVDTQLNTTTVLLEETDNAYVDVTDDLTFLADDSFIWTSERDGWNHLYLYDQDGKLMNQITQGSWEVTQYYGYVQNEDRVYYQSTENGSINRGVYSVDSSGKKKRALAVAPGTNSADFSADFTYFIHTYSSTDQPPAYTLYRALNGKKVKEIKNNDGLLKTLQNYQISPKEFSTLQVNGQDLNMYMMKPLDFDASQKYPMFMYQYSGPGSQNVSNRWMAANDYWHQQLVAEGYIVVCVDGRGTGFKGRDFKKATYLNLVKYETEDQIAAAQILSALPYIDEDRTGIWGWSFGGHMATNCILKGNDTFEMAIAVAPVTSWRFYDTIYTERFMRTPAENPSGYDDNSPFNYPELLKGNYLLVHGSGDDNVHVQNTMRMIEALVQANKPFDWAIYPDKNHGIYGGNTRIHLYNKMTQFVKEHL
jgi:dipeptidyl-peptidase 4